MSLDDDLMFADESDGEDSSHKAHPDETWKVMVVDDDESIHTVTGLVLNNFVFDNKKLEFVHAYSGDEAKALIGSHPDTAVLLLDVVMETDLAGLDVVKFVRNSLCNQFVRIVLRTGQPGQAPETEIITEYDINDYKEKTELTAHKLHTLLYSCLRSYRDIITLEKNKCTLENVIEASARIFEEDDISHLESSLVFQASTLLFAPEDGELIDPEARVLCCSPNNADKMEVKATLGSWSQYQGKPISEIPSALLEAMKKSQQTRSSVYTGPHCALYLRSPAGKEFLLGLEADNDITPFERDVMEIFAYNTGLALKKTLAPSADHDDTRDYAGQMREIIAAAGRTADRHYPAAGAHTQSIQGVTRLLAQRVGMADDEIDTLCDAVGLFGLSCLNKLPLSAATEAGAVSEALEQANQVLASDSSSALIIATNLMDQYHENWDGSGLPGHIEKNEISLQCQIFKVANDFYVAGLSIEAGASWPISKMLNAVESQKSSVYSPAIVDELNLLSDDIEAILNNLS